MVNSAPFYSVGWDVRGWQSKQQAVAIARLGADGLSWGISRPFRLPPGQPVTIQALTSAVSTEEASLVDRARRVVVAIDAPLGFPVGLLRFLTQPEETVTPPKIEIRSRLAYRDCERWVKDEFNKKPLSAAFDKLGSNATLAMTLMRHARAAGFTVMPFGDTPSDRTIIEVYPGIAKRAHKKNERAIEAVERWMPNGPVPGSDEYDACICAILGLVFGGAGPILGLPNLIPPPRDRQDQAKREGWIYALPASFVHAAKEEAP